MQLPLTLLLLARHADASPTSRGDGDDVVVEVVSGDADTERGWCSVAVDRTTDELVVKASTRTWNRMSAVFDQGADHGDLLRIAVAGRGTAARVAPLLREANPGLMIVDDPATNTILVTGMRSEG